MMNHDNITADGKSTRNGVEFELKDRVLIIHIQGDFDDHNASYIREYTDKKLLTSNVRNVIFDFSQVEFMDSSGIGVILGRCRRLTFLGGGRVAVIGVSNGINRIFRLSGLYAIIDKYQSLTDALQAMIKE